MVGEARAYVQGASLKARAAFPTKGFSTPRSPEGHCVGCAIPREGEAMGQAIAIIFVCLAIWGFISEQKSKKRREKEWAQSHERRLNDDRVIQAKIDFDNWIENSHILPDGIRFKSSYIYKQMISVWFMQLLAQTRYDENLNKKIKSDFLEYIGALREGHTRSFLSLEEKDPRKSEEHHKIALADHATCETVEMGFANLIGPSAVQSLNRVRAMHVADFDEHGNLRETAVKLQSLTRVP
jgi:hypothetical protein